jgi:hemerythrin-like domain-containing protein
VIDAEETFHAYDRELLKRLRDAMEELEDDTEVADEVALARLTKLAEDFVRYVEANEDTLYPAVAPLVRSYGEVMAPMLLDVRAIDDLAREGEQIALDDLTRTEEGRRSRRRRIERLAERFEAIVRLHFDKLEQIYVPMLAELQVEERHAVLEGMAAEYEPHPAWPERASRGA